MSASYIVTAPQRPADEHPTLLAAMAAATRLVLDGVRGVRVRDTAQGITWTAGRL